MKIWHEIKKIDASAGAKTVTIPEGTLSHSAYTVTPGKKITVTVCGRTSTLDIGESLVANQVMGINSSPGIYPTTVIGFETGSLGTVTYVADGYVGPITVA